MSTAARTRVSGQYAGPVSRLVANVLDAFLIAFLFGGLVAAGTYAIELVSDVTVDTDEGWWLLVFWVGFAFLYRWVGLAIAGRTPGMLLVGMKVVRRDGQPLSPGRAFIRVLTFPLSFLLLGLGLVGVVIGREPRRAARRAGRVGRRLRLGRPPRRAPGTDHALDRRPRRPRTAR